MRKLCTDGVHSNETYGMPSSCVFTLLTALFVCACVRACVYVFYLLTIETFRNTTQTASQPDILSIFDLLITFYLPYQWYVCDSHNIGM